MIPLYNLYNLLPDNTMESDRQWERQKPCVEAVAPLWPFTDVL